MSDAGVSIVIPVLNGGALFRRCLDTIRDQDLDPGRVEVLVMDGGSTDGTREHAAAHGATVVDNPLRLAEPGVKLGMAQARHELRVVLAADNGLPRRDWLSAVLAACDQAGARGVFTHVVDAPIDSSFCRYFNHLHADPFNWFVYGDAAHPARFGRVYPTLDHGPGWTVWDLAQGDPPLLALAQGFALRGALPEGENLQDDILPLWQLLEAGERFAYVDCGVLHHTLEGFRDFVAKYRRRAAAALAAPDAAHKQRHGRVSRRRRLRRLLWIPYAFSIVLPLLDAVRGYRADGRPEWAWHPLACLALALVMAEAVLRQVLARS